MEENKMTVPYIVYEGEQARNERMLKRLIVAVIVAIAVIFATNLAWLYAWMQYDYYSYTTEDGVSVDAENGIANYIGNNGSIVNGTDSGQAENNAEN